MDAKEQNCTLVWLHSDKEQLVSQLHRLPEPVAD